MPYARDGRCATLLLLMLCPGLLWAQPAPTVKVGNQTKRTSGTVTALEAGDVACYLSLKDDQGARFKELAVFEICEQKLVGKRVSLRYELGSVMSDECGGNPDCKKTRRVALVNQAQVLDAKAKGAPPAPGSAASKK